MHATWFDWAIAMVSPRTATRRLLARQAFEGLTRSYEGAAARSDARSGAQQSACRQGGGGAGQQHRRRRHHAARGIGRRPDRPNRQRAVAGVGPQLRCRRAARLLWPADPRVPGDDRRRRGPCPSSPPSRRGRLGHSGPGAGPRGRLSRQHEERGGRVGTSGSGGRVRCHRATTRLLAVRPPSGRCLRRAARRFQEHRCAGRRDRPCLRETAHPGTGRSLGDAGDPRVAGSRRL